MVGFVKILPSLALAYDTEPSCRIVGLINSIIFLTAGLM